jgi:hypothetical protein
LSYKIHRNSTAEWLKDRDGLVAELARDELADIGRQSEGALLLEKRIRERVRLDAPRLLAVPGCGPLSAAKIVAETAGVYRFSTEATFAPFRRRSTVTGVVGFDPGSDALRQDRQPASQRRAAPHRHDTTSTRWHRPRVLPQTHRGWRAADACPAPLETSSCPNGLQQNESRRSSGQLNSADSHEYPLNQPHAGYPRRAPLRHRLLQPRSLDGCRWVSLTLPDLLSGDHNVIRQLSTVLVGSRS